MDWQNFEQEERLTDAEKYCDYKIVVCAFKKKSKRLVKIKDKTLDLIYLDDVCRELDADGQQTPLSSNSKVDKPVSLWRRVVYRIKDGEVLIAILRRYRRKHGPLKNKFWIDQLPTTQLTLSELFIKVLYSKPTNYICNALETTCYIHFDGRVNGCWEVEIPFGNIKQNDLATVYNSTQARIVRLASVNKSLCLCDHNRCEYNGRYLAADKLVNKPAYIELGIDQSCNLACPQCRKEHFSESKLTDDKLSLIRNISNNSWLNSVANLRLAGTGEVFYSKLYLHLLENILQRDQIQILSNGTLFDKQNFEKLKKYQNIDVMISVDAATAATYRKLRGGDFQQLRQNMEMLGELRTKGKIRWFESNYIVQRDNCSEMVEFVRLAKKLHIDRVHFMVLNNWGTFTEREYRDKCMIIRHRRLHRDLQRILRDPIFKDPIVDLMAFSRYIKNFDQKFPQALHARAPYEW